MLARTARGGGRRPLHVAATAAPGPSPFEEKTVYNDNVIDRVFITLFSRKMAETLGVTKYDGTYETFVSLSREIMRGRNTAQQRETVARVLDSLLPPNAPATFRRLFPFTKATAEFNAWLTTIFFKWLVGDSELQTIEVEYEGRTEQWRSGVLIKKCRYLENSGCVGMCVNMCKVPTQAFFTDSFGLPLHMVPNFEDLSCEMRYGQVPPRFEDDEVYSQPCLASSCMLGTPVSQGAEPCPKLDTERGKKAAAA